MNTFIIRLHSSHQFSCFTLLLPLFHLACVSKESIDRKWYVRSEQFYCRYNITFVITYRAYLHAFITIWNSNFHFTLPKRHKNKEVAKGKVNQNNQENSMYSSDDDGMH